MRVIGVRRVIWVFGVLCVLGFRLLFSLFLGHSDDKVRIGCPQVRILYQKSICDLWKSSEARRCWELNVV